MSVVWCDGPKTHVGLCQFTSQFVSTVSQSPPSHWICILIFSFSCHFSTQRVCSWSDQVGSAWELKSRMLYTELSPRLFEKSGAWLCCNKPEQLKEQPATVWLIHQSLQITVPLSLSVKQKLLLFSLLTSVKFSIPLSEVNFYIEFLAGCHYYLVSKRTRKARVR